MDIFPIPAFSDNYIWTLVREGDAVVVDPGDARPVLQALGERGLHLRAILVTHHHPDHVGGLAALKRAFDVPVFGPRAEATRIPGLSAELAEGDAVEVLGRRFEVLEMPGHTLGHIAYHAPGVLLCGDTLFSAGCGRLFEGTPQQLHRSLSRLSALPEDTAVYCTHEYTLSNLAFAQALEPDNPALSDYVQQVRARRAAGLPSLPSSIGLERRINPFLRCKQAALRARVERHAGHALGDETEVFAVLRQWKDGFRASAA